MCKPKPKCGFCLARFIRRHMGGTVNPRLAKYLDGDFITAWRGKMHTDRLSNNMEATVMAAPMSRFNNYFIEGLQWLLEKTHIDGLYFDDVAFDRGMPKAGR